MAIPEERRKKAQKNIESKSGKKWVGTDSIGNSWSAQEVNMTAKVSPNQMAKKIQLNALTMNQVRTRFLNSGFSLKIFMAFSALLSIRKKFRIYG